MTGHGHVTPNPDGWKARCGGPAICAVCAGEAAGLPRVVRYDRAVLVDVLVYHWRTDNSGCGCGWAELGRSHAEHVASVYEASILARGGQART